MIDAFQHAYPVSLVLQAKPGARLEDVQSEAGQWAQQLGCDIVYLSEGRIGYVRFASEKAGNGGDGG